MLCKILQDFYVLWSSFWLDSAGSLLGVTQGDWILQDLYKVLRWALKFIAVSCPPSEANSMGFCFSMCNDFCFGRCSWVSAPPGRVGWEAKILWYLLLSLDQHSHSKMLTSSCSQLTAFAVSHITTQNILSLWPARWVNAGVILLYPSLPGSSLLRASGSVSAAKAAPIGWIRLGRC